MFFDVVLDVLHRRDGEFLRRVPVVDPGAERDLAGGRVSVLPAADLRFLVVGGLLCSRFFRYRITAPFASLQVGHLPRPLLNPAR
ncbi:hypothetical protein [Actinomadura sp. HBU206391]|uniref:hypothetical protein n=1 Tax=Actinomadura sp. HBU206391 TaxID=2731692 RepID=UPI001C9D56CE|nr:hypothetical protein [Actinomadura sp. HBU206391]